MKAVKLFAIALGVYVGIVVAFESLLGVIQPAGEGTLVITTTDEDGAAHDRVVSRLESGGRLYVAANHWPRAWYHRALANPDVRVTRDGDTADYRAVPVSGEERERLLDDSRFPLIAYLFTGFAPRQFLRLEPR